MSVTVQQVYDQVCFALCENGGLVLGLFSQADFLQALGTVLLDFAQRAPLDKSIFTESIVSGTGVYVIPEDIQQADACFVAGKLIEKVSEADLTQGYLNWRTKTGKPKQWHSDNLLPKRLELYPTPDFSGTAVGGSPPGTYDGFFPSQKNLSIVGPSLPSKTAWLIGDTLDGILDSFTPYLVYGVLEQVFNAEGEMRDAQRAAYCHTRYMEGVSLSVAIAEEELGESADG